MRRRLTSVMSLRCSSKGEKSYSTGTGSISADVFYYDVIQDKYSPYGKNWVCSVGYSFNL
ncbi:MAG: hypothetical protein ACLU4J_10690 [Butyricimonas paravirosa]